MPDPDASISAAPSAPVSSSGLRTHKRRILRGLLTFLAVMLVITAGGVAWVGMALRQRSPSLLARATKVMDMKNCQEYAWKSDHEIARYNFYLAGTSYSVYDTNTHRTTPIVMLKKHVASLMGGMPTGPRRFEYPKPDVVRIEIWDKTPKDWGKQAPLTHTPADHVVFLRKPNAKQDIAWLGLSPVISPHNDRAVWWFSRQQQPLRWAALLHRYIPSLNINPQSVQDVYVSHLDGSDMRLIGSIPTMPSNDQELMRRGSFVFAFSHAVWTPDGKRLCFPYGDSLYTVPVE